MIVLAVAFGGGVAGAQLTPADEFRSVCESLRLGDNEFYGRAQIDDLRDYLDRRNPAATNAVRARGLLAAHLLRVGEEEEALELFEEALAMAQAQGMSSALRLALIRDVGLANLRIAEVSNCVAMHGPAMCLYPVLPAGIHTDPRAASRAADAYLRFLQDDPHDRTVRWLLNVAAMVAGRYPQAVPPEWRVRDPSPPTGLPRFVDIAAQRGLSIRDSSGGGVMEDLDVDGHMDIATSSAEPCTPLRFFRGGAHGFHTAAEAAGLEDQLGGLNLVHADYDNDGFIDLLVLRGGWMGADGGIRNSLLRNNGDGTFEDVTLKAGLAFPAYPTQTAAWADFDGDGDLDLYVGNEHDVMTGGTYAPSQLFRNRGDGTFEDVAGKAGVRNLRFAKGVAWGDADNDGDSDLYVSNIGPNRLYRNDGGRFTDIAPEAGLTAPEGRSFASWFFDIDNDGALEIFVADYSASTDDIAAWMLGEESSTGAPVLYSRPGADWRNMAPILGLTAPALPMGANFGDLDNDGFLDLYLGTGLPDYESIMPNLMYRNVGGEAFVDVTAEGGFGHLQKGHGVAFGDVDGDGDQDVFQQMGGAYPGDAYPSVLYENPGHDAAWTTLRLIGRRSDRSALGARVDIWVTENGASRRIHRIVGTGGSFGGNTTQLEVGLGAESAIERLEIHWPGSAEPDRHFDLPVRSVILLREREPEPALIATSR